MLELFGIGLFVLGAGIAFYYAWKLWQGQQEARRIREEFDLSIAAAMSKINSANQEIEELQKPERGYFRRSEADEWRDNHAELHQTFSDVPAVYRKKPSAQYEAVKQFMDLYRSLEEKRRVFNKKFVEREMNEWSNLFDNVEGRTLDNQQRKAIVTDEDSNLIIAGAGSGKTTTIVGKVQYLLQRFNVDPREILLISFTRKSVSSLAERIGVDGVQAKTFHKLGLDILTEVVGSKPSVFDDNQFRPLIAREFNRLLTEGEYLKKVTEYFVHFLKEPRAQDTFTNRGEYIDYIKDNNFRSYKSIKRSAEGRETYAREIVKSIEECQIANFLLFNRVNYHYERQYEFDTATKNHQQYKPDFTIEQDGKVVYLEHFALSRSGEVPHWFAKEGQSHLQATREYIEGVEWKRKTHAEHETKLVESFSYEMAEGILFDNLKMNLEQAGIVLDPMTPEERWEIIKDVAPDEINTVVDLFCVFISLLKSNNYTFKEIRAKSGESFDAFGRARTRMFLDILEPIFQYYEIRLSQQGEIDFSDMINKAAHYVSAGHYTKTYKYIIIDEFQDLSIGRYGLVKALKDKSEGCRLFCVGDDWQSIYRFAGSDIALFKDFEEYFGFSERSKIETTYRFYDPLLTTSSTFVQRNPNQTPKELRSTENDKSTNFELRFSANGDLDQTQQLVEIFKELYESNEDVTNKDILVLGRYSFDIDSIKNSERKLSINKQAGTITYREPGLYKQITARFLTIHKAKGLEADIVILLNCNSGKYGFPSELSDDRVLSLVLSEADQFENGEERRLFYVAMTRAREKLYLVADSYLKSKFIKELDVDSDTAEKKRCPRCITADVVLRKMGVAANGYKYQFYGCTNYAYGCDYNTTEWIAPESEPSVDK